MKTFLKEFLKIFLLNLILYPRPYCQEPGIFIPSLIDSTKPIAPVIDSGITCNIAIPPSTFFGLIFSILFPMHPTAPTIDLPIVLLISLSTLLMYRLFKKANVFQLNKKRPMKIILFIIIWIILMIVFSVPYYFYIKSHPSPGVII